MKNAAKFTAVKLAVIIIVDIIAVIVGFLASFLIGGLPIESSDQSAAMHIVEIISSALAGFAFFGYMFRTATRMKNIDGSPAAFALKETAPYALFLLPLAVLGICGVTPGMLSGVAGIVYAPHMAFALAGLNAAVNALIFTLLYAVMNYLAAVLRKKKHLAGDGTTE